MLEENKGKKVLVIAALIHTAAFAAFIIICVSLEDRLTRDAVSIGMSVLALLVAIELLLIRFLVKKLPRVAKVYLTCKAIFLLSLSLSIFSMLQFESAILTNLFMVIAFGSFLFGMAYLIYAAIRQARAKGS